ncbi:hypothetical protein [Corynebacterium argentoratense]|uniref:hypothetical protein n=1 Tax=Corynebacterium argentoratense TaxID=42817 RepID=UPI001F27D7B0|nr:hypothetical protein [Corynebacterium argentoratense]MCF1765229.1 hypothetical protein [Corynebacterium argentoratense]
MKRMSMTGVALVAGTLALAACTPPNEKPSDVRVDTATAVEAPSTTAKAAESTDEAQPAAAAKDGKDAATPTYRGLCAADKGERKPKTLSLACADNNDELVNIKWNSWTDTQATGTATRRTNECIPNCADGKFVESQVEVALINPANLGTSPDVEFTTLMVDGQPFAS